MAQGLQLPRQLAAYRSMTSVEEANVRAFLAGGAFPPGAAEQPMAVPYPDAALLAGWLSDERIRRFLPSNLQSAIPPGQGPAAPRQPRPDRLAWLRDGLLAAAAPAAIIGLVGFAGLVLLAPLLGARTLPTLLLARYRRRDRGDRP